MLHHLHHSAGLTDTGPGVSWPLQCACAASALPSSSSSSASRSELLAMLQSYCRAHSAAVVGAPASAHIPSTPRQSLGGAISNGGGSSLQASWSSQEVRPADDAGSSFHQPFSSCLCHSPQTSFQAWCSRRSHQSRPDQPRSRRAHHAPSCQCRRAMAAPRPHGVALSKGPRQSRLVSRRLKVLA